MTKPIFLKVVSTDGANCLVAVGNQTHNVGGKENKIDPTLMVTPRGADLVLEEGEIWATNSLVKKQQGWYVAGTEIYKLTDELGIIFTQPEEWSNATHEMWCKNYSDFQQGKPFREARDFGMPEQPKRQTKSLLSKLQLDRRLAPPTIEDDGWYVDKDLWYFLLRSIKKQKNILMIGASGSGKTELIRFMVEKINKNLSIFDMAVSNPNKTFCGNLRADGGNTYFQLARFAEKIQQEGLILMDELSRAVPTANNIFLPVLDGRRTLYIEEAIDPNHAQIKVNEKCMFWATANIGAEFVGTSSLDHALLNRFHQVGIHYPPADKESLLLQKRYDLDKKTSDTLVKVVNEIRNNADLSKDISTRQLFEVAELVSDGYKPLEAFKWSVLQQFEGNEHDGGERQTVMAILQSL